MDLDIEALRQLPSNKMCADCRRSNVEALWASVNLGVFVCIDCSGIHRSLGTHISFVRSCTLDSWSAEQVQRMSSMGNERALLYYEAKIDRDFPLRPSAQGAWSAPTMEQWIRDKYERKLYQRDEQIGQWAEHRARGGFSVPDVVWIRILSLLDAPELARCAQTCKRLERLSLVLWKSTCERRWPADAVSAPAIGCSWRRLHLAKLSLASAARKFFGDGASLPCELFHVGDALPDTAPADKCVVDSGHGFFVEFHLVAHDIDANAASSSLSRRRKTSSVAASSSSSSSSSPSSPSLPLSSTALCPLMWLVINIDRFGSSEQFDEHVRSMATRTAGLALVRVCVLVSKVTEGAIAAVPYEVARHTARERASLEFVVRADVSSDDAARRYATEALGKSAQLVVAKLALLGWPGVNAPPIWMPDSASSHCLVCHCAFSFTNRRHHCRACGILICKNDSRNGSLPHIYASAKSQRLCPKCHQRFCS
jgi:Putative GTPase activating protein for Arf/FYVE zinc finger/F-box-like